MLYQLSYSRLGLHGLIQATVGLSIQGGFLLKKVTQACVRLMLCLLACFLAGLLACELWESFGFVVAQVPEAWRRVPV